MVENKKRCCKCSRLLNKNEGEKGVDRTAFERVKTNFEGLIFFKQRPLVLHTLLPPHLNTRHITTTQWTAQTHHRANTSSPARSLTAASAPCHQSTASLVLPSRSKRPSQLASTLHYISKPSPSRHHFHFFSLVMNE